MFPKHLCVVVTAAALAFSGGSAWASGSQTANVSITANVIQSCTALTPASGTMTFPDYDAFANKTAPDNLTTPVTFTTHCTKNAANVNFTVSGGSNCTSSPVSGDRAMKNGTEYIAYQLYQDSGYSTPWAIDTSTCAGTTQLSAGSVASSSQDLSFDLYGQIPAGQDAAVGSGYSDSVTVAVNY